MSAVFHFDDDDIIALKRRSSVREALGDLHLEDIDHDEHELDPEAESGYVSEADPEELQADNASLSTTYEVKLEEEYISSSVVANGNLPKHKVSKNDFEVLKLLGRGAYGKVMLCRHIESQKLYAMKVLHKASLMVHTKNAEHTKAERQILEEVQHPFIVHLFYAFQTDDRLYLIMEYAPGGELFTHMATERMFSEKMTTFYMAELLLALEHLHNLGIVYRDLKPENCLLGEDGHVVLTDFGLSKVSLDGRTNTMCGTAEYMAPEILQGKPYDKCVDWWTFGILMFEMLTGCTPFRASNKKKTLEAIQKKKIKIPYYLTNDAKDLIERLLKKDPKARIGRGDDGAKQIKAHCFFRKIDWNQLCKRATQPPIIPVITDPALAENFDDKFTTAPIAETPLSPPSHLVTEHMDVYFKNFSYVSQPPFFSS